MYGYPKVINTLEDNPRAPIHRLGFTVDEVQALIDQIEGAQ